MKTLILMRHAKSSWKHPELADRERPLNKRGEKDAPRMGKLIREEGLEPQVILSSSAVRCAKTAEIVAEKLDYKQEVQYLDDLYLAEPNVILDQFRNLPEEIETVLVVGHNPGLEGLLQILTMQVDALPTGAVAVVEVPVRTWQALDVRIDCKLTKFWKPK